MAVATGAETFEAVGGTPDASRSGTADASRRHALGPFSFVIATTDLVLVAAWVARDAGSMTVLAWHVGITLLAGALTWGVLRREGGNVAGAVLLCLLLGPIGGIVLVVADLGRDRPLRRGAADMETRTEASRAERLHAQITQDRRRRTRETLPDTFTEIFGAGTLVRQQEAIAAISLSYRPEMLPALRRALESDIAAIRVQAAAVFAKLRGQFGERAKAVLAAAASGTVTADLIVEARCVAASGFVDAETAAELMAHAARRPTSSGRDVVASPSQRRRAALTRSPRLKRYSCGGIA